MSQHAPLFFPFAEFWWFYLAFLGLVLGLLALDLGVFHRTAKEVSFREAAGWSVVWISLALGFNVGLYFYSIWLFGSHPDFLTTFGLNASDAARQVAVEFLTGFLVEKSLAVDNIFLFAVVFGYFRIPLQYQHRVLFYGILGALVFRSIFIALGSILMTYHAVVWVFGIILIFTGFKMVLSKEQAMEPEKNLVVRLAHRFFKVTPKLHGDRFLVNVEGGRAITPLFLALILIEFSDIVFAIDSVPAIFALTKEPLIVFTSNIFAILGLRSMYFMLAGVMDRFEWIKYGLAGVLVFVGSKMTWLLPLFDGKFPISWSLGIIAALIGGSILASVLFRRAKA